MKEAALYDIIRKPVISEKSTLLGSNNQYVMEVQKSSDKPAVKKAVEKIFSVKVKSVNSHNRKGKNKTFKGVKGQRNDRKFVIVTLEKGQEIDLTGGIK